VSSIVFVQQARPFVDALATATATVKHDEVLFDMVANSNGRRSEGHATCWKGSDVRFKAGGWGRRLLGVFGEVIRKQVQPPWRGAGRRSFVKLYRKLRSRACTAGP
jgi:hypothetical protein